MSTWRKAGKGSHGGGGDRGGRGWFGSAYDGIAERLGFGPAAVGPLDACEKGEDGQAVSESVDLWHFQCGCRAKKEDEGSPSCSSNCHRLESTSRVLASLHAPLHYA